MSLQQKAPLAATTPVCCCVSHSLVRHRQLALREVYALAALSGCRTVLRYFGAWIEDGFLYTQTEMCCGSVEQLVLNQQLAVMTQSQRAAPVVASSSLRGGAAVEDFDAAVDPIPFPLSFGGGYGIWGWGGGLPLCM